MFDKPELVSFVLSGMYKRHYEQIYNRGIKQLVYNLFKKYDVKNFDKRYRNE